MRAIFLPAALSAVLVSGVASGDTATATSRARAGEYDARGTVRCSQEVGQTPGDCEAAVARSETSAAVVVFFPNGFSRMLLFSEGRFLRGNATMSGVGTDTDWQLSAGVFSVRVDDQRFEIPQALVLGP